MSKAAGVCPKCNGKHWKYETSEDSEVPIPVPCVCLKSHMWAGYLGHDLFNVQAVESHLYNPVIDPETRDISGDMTEDNLFIKGLWSEVTRHLKFVLYSKRKQHQNFTFRIVDDSMLLEVWLGKHSYTSRSKQTRDTDVTYNSLRDLLEDPSLMIIKLGVMSTPNRAAPRVLMEALAIRHQLNKPVWLVEGWNPFGGNHLCYSPEVDNFIDEHYDVEDLGGDVQTEREARREAAKLFGEDGESVGFSGDGDMPPRLVPLPPDISEQEEERFKANSRPKGYNNSKRKKKGGSGGGGKVSGPSTGL